MNKLVLLNEMRKENNFKNDINKNIDEDYITFENIFCKNKEEILVDDNIYKKEIHIENKINNIMKRIFLLENKTPFIDFINYIYDDFLGTNSEIMYIEDEEINNLNNMGTLKNLKYNIKIKAQDDYRSFEYEIQFKTDDYENIALKVLKKDSNFKSRNVINFNQKKKRYEKLINENEKSLKSNSDLHLIMLNSNIKVPDVYEIKYECSNGEFISYKLDIFKGWKYDFKQLFEKNMYFLFPMKVFDLKKRLYAISNSMESNILIKDEIVKFFGEMNRYLKKVKDKNLMTNDDIDEFNLIARELLNYFMKEKNIFI